MMDALWAALKWGVFGNAIFMLIWLGLRGTVFHNSPSWLVFDALIVVGSIMIAHRYHEDENEY
jgi:hypothetical protein